MSEKGGRLDRGRVVVGGIGLLALGAAAVTLVIYGPFRTASGGSDEARQENSTTLSLSVTPTYDWELFGGELQPVFDHLLQTTGVTLEVIHPETVASAVEDVLEERTDVAILPALACAQVEEWGGRVLVIQEHGGSSSAEGLLVTRAGGDMALLLPTRSICLVGPGSTMGHLAPRAWMRSKRINQEERFPRGVLWYGNHRSALAALEEGRCDVAAVSDLALAMARGRGGFDGTVVEELDRTAHLPTPCWAARRELSSTSRRALVEALEEYGQGIESPSRYQITGFHQISNTTYRAVRLGARLTGLLRRHNTQQ